MSGGEIGLDSDGTTVYLNVNSTPLHCTAYTTPNDICNLAQGTHRNWPAYISCSGLRTSLQDRHRSSPSTILLNRNPIYFGLKVCENQLHCQGFSDPSDSDDAVLLLVFLHI